jgi:ADP-dependent NAD(P)H-hydrate dehydratase / NAD(P)H-hydrate epimerase
VLPIATPEEMQAIDAASPEPFAVLVARAGHAVARIALEMLGGAYGRQVVVIAGRGNNGADGRVAADHLRRRGVSVRVIDVAHAPAVLPPVDLVIDAAFGTGFHGEWTAPRASGVPVLAVDIPSGVDGRTGAAGPGVLRADRTVTFAAMKPGHLLVPGSTLCGPVDLIDIGLDTSSVRAHLVEGTDVAQWWQPRPRDAHKWQRSVRIVAGSGGMRGAAHLTATGAARAGAGIVHLSVPSVAHDTGAPTEVVVVPVSPFDWADDVLRGLDRFASLVIGPGLGRDEHVAAQVRRIIAEAPIPVVVDADALFALAWHPDGAGSVLRGRDAPTVLTPHDGEFALLTGERPGPDRFAAVRRLSAETGAVVLLKGPVSVAAEPLGAVLVAATGDARLATAGTGDVLAGTIGALLAQRMAPLRAAAGAAWIHGRAARAGSPTGLVAGDLPDLIAEVIASTVLDDDGAPSHT